MGHAAGSCKEDEVQTRGTNGWLVLLALHMWSIIMDVNTEYLLSISAQTSPQKPEGQNR